VVALLLSRLLHVLVARARARGFARALSESLRRSSGLLPVEPSLGEGPASPVDPEPTSLAPPPAPPEGNDVAEVRSTAERAVERIRETALREAGEIRAAAAGHAAAVAEAEARRADADGYSEETRAAADAYAEATRRESEKQAAKIISQAKEQARRIRAEAEQKARTLEAEATRHRDAAARTSEDIEDRIKSMLTAFREATRDLEGLLPDEPRDGGQGPERRSDEPLDAALRPRPPRA
jgi:hypothetical protein